MLGHTVERRILWYRTLDTLAFTLRSDALSEYH